MLAVERISTSSGFEEIRDEWNALLSRANSISVHLVHSWLAAWARTFGRRHELCVLRISDGSETIGFAPLMFSQMKLKGFLPYRQVLFMGDPWVDFCDFIIVRDRQAVIAAVLNYLRTREEWGEILLHNIPETSPNFGPLRAVVDGLGARNSWKVESPCYHIPMKGRSWEEFWPTTNKNFVRKDIVRLGNHYADHNWRVIGFDSATVLDHLPTMARLHEASQERKGRSSIYQQPVFREFLDRLRNEPDYARKILGFVLEIDGVSAAYVLGFEHRRVFYYWHIGFDMEFAKLSPSKFLLYNILRSGFEDERWDEFNFMRGATDYKRRWASHSYDLYQLRLLNTRGVYGAMNRLRTSAVVE